MKALRRLAALAIVLFASQAHAQSSATPNLEGTWAHLIVTTSVAKLPVLGKTTNVSYFYARVKVRQEGQKLTVETDPCMVRMQGEVKRVQTIVPRAMVEAMGPKRRSGRVTDDGTVIFDRAVDVLGAKLEKPWTDDLPTEADDPKVVDEDGDGKPGVTVRIVGPVDGEVYVVQRAWNALRGTVREDGESVRGLVEWGDSQEVIGASSMLLKANPGASPHPDADRSWFEMKRIAPGATCDWVRKNNNKLFEL